MSKPLPISAKLIFKALKGIRNGTLILSGPNGFQKQFGECAGQSDPNSSETGIIEFKDWGIFRQIILKGDIAFAESYMEGKWDTHNLTKLLSIISNNRSVLDRPIRGFKLTNSINRLRHLLRKNSKHQARRNITYHYDLGNDFYQLWLDRSMSYSSGIYGNNETSNLSNLEAAQLRKIDRAISMLGHLDKTSETLEIGCGWGELAARRLEKLPGRHTGITLSTEQQQWAIDVLKERDLSVRGKIKLMDYREIEGTYDGIISIEMIEAVGKEFWPNYFMKIKNSLKPEGRAIIQVITIAKGLEKKYQTGVDFIQKYIFPGGMLMSKSQFEEITRFQGLEIEDRFDFGYDYARTLQDWNQQFILNWPRIEQLGFGEKFKRMWQFYLSYCSAGFLNRDLDVSQYTLKHSLQN